MTETRGIGTIGGVRDAEILERPERGETIAFVLTMGALHRHLSLMREGKHGDARCERVREPGQFGGAKISELHGTRTGI
jgi:hypothetical protein